MKTNMMMPLAALNLTALFALSAHGATLRYNGSGDWNNVSNNDSGWGENPNNPPVASGSLPGAGDTARINFGNNTVTVTSDVPATERVQIGVDEGGNLVVASGGILTTTGELRVGNNGAGVTASLAVHDGGTLNVGGILWSSTNSATGDITIDSGGSVTVGNHLWLGISTSSTISISGVLTQTSGILGLGTSNASTPSGGTATVNIFDGGLLTLNNISGAAGTPSIQPGSVIDLQGSGRLTLPGDFVGSINNYIDANKITGNGTPGAENLTVVFDSGVTTVTAIPEPSSFLLLGVAGALALFSRRK